MKRKLKEMVLGAKCLVLGALCAVGLTASALPPSPYRDIWSSTPDSQAIKDPANVIDWGMASRTFESLDAKHGKFLAASADEMIAAYTARIEKDPTDCEALICRAFAYLKKAGENEAFDRLAKEFGYTFDNDTMHFTGELIHEKGKTPEMNEASDEVCGILLPLLKSAFEDLSAVPKNWKGNVAITPDVYPVDEAVYFDWADVLMSKSLLAETMCILNMVKGFDVTMDSDLLPFTFDGRIPSDEKRGVQAILENNPEFYSKVRDQKALTEAGDWWASAATLLDQWDKAHCRRSDGKMHFFDWDYEKLDSNGTYGLEWLRRQSAELANLPYWASPLDYTKINGSDRQFTSFKPLFEGKVLRANLPEFGVGVKAPYYNEPLIDTCPDSTFCGMWPSVSPTYLASYISTRWTKIPPYTDNRTAPVYGIWYKNMFDLGFNNEGNPLWFAWDNATPIKLLDPEFNVRGVTAVFKGWSGVGHDGNMPITFEGSEIPTPIGEPMKYDWRRMELTANFEIPKVTYLDFDETSGKMAERTDECELVNAETTEFTTGKVYAVAGDIKIVNRITVWSTPENPAKLVLCDGARLWATNGVEVDVRGTATNALVICGQALGTGTLESTGYYNHSGIGGGGGTTGKGAVCGIVTINGGTVMAKGGYDGAGIGGGAQLFQKGVGGTVTINGGTVIATGGEYGAGIGGGHLADGGTVTINGGTVTATSTASGTSSFFGAGIGAGYNGKSHGTVKLGEGIVSGVEAGELERRGEYVKPFYMTTAEYVADHHLQYVMLPCYSLKIPEAEGYSYAVSYEGAQLNAVLADGTNTYAIAAGATARVRFTLDEDHVWTKEPEENPILIKDFSRDMVLGEGDLPTVKFEKKGTEGNPWAVGYSTRDSVAAWTNGTDKLVVEGEGNMEDFTEGNPAPWGTGIAEVEIGADVTGIGARAFADSQLGSVTIPASVTSIGAAAFLCSTSLSNVTVEAMTPPALGEGAFVELAEGYKICVPTGTGAAYKAAPDWSLYADSIVEQGSPEYPWTVGEGVEAYLNGTELVIGGAGTISDLSKIPDDVKSGIDAIAITASDVTGAASDAFEGIGNFKLTLPDGWQGELPDEDGNWYGATGVTLSGLPLAVKNVKFAQRYPWNGLVDVGFTLTGPAGEANVVVTAKDGATDVTNFTAAVTIPAGGVLATNLVWDAATAGLAANFKSDSITVEVALVPPPLAVQLWENGPYFATCNIGATTPEGYGILANFDDAAQAVTNALGEGWHLPTKDEWKALLTNCGHGTWTEQNSVWGRLFTGTGDYESNSIFLPAAGFDESGDGRGYDGDRGYCWSSAVEGDASASCLGFTSGSCAVIVSYRSRGLSVRAVRDAAPAASAISAKSEAGALDLRTAVSLDAGAVTVSNVTWSATQWGNVPETFTTVGWTNLSTGATGVFGNLSNIMGEGAKDAVLPQKDGDYVLTHSTGDLKSFATFTVSGYPVGGETNPWTVGPEDDPDGTVAWKDRSGSADVYFQPPRSAVSRTGFETITNAMGGASFPVWLVSADGSATNAVKMIIGASGRQYTSIGEMLESDDDSWTFFDITDCVVNYDGMGHSGTMAPDTFLPGIPTNLTANAFTAFGYEFQGWTTNYGSEVVFADKARIDDPKLGAVYDLQAVWKCVPVSVGDGVTACLDENGTLHIEGNGEMKDFTAADPAPWAEFAPDIKAIEVAEGVTKVGNAAFAVCPTDEDAAVYFEDPAHKINLGAFVSGDGTVTNDLSAEEFLQPGAYGGVTNAVQLLAGTDPEAPRYGSVAEALDADEVTEVVAYTLEGLKGLAETWVAEAAGPQPWTENVEKAVSEAVTAIEGANDAESVWNAGINGLNETRNAKGEDEKDPEIVGTIPGSDVTWKFGGNQLDLSGAGDVPELTAETVPWSNSVEKIATVVVGEGVTGLGKGLFTSGITAPAATVIFESADVWVPLAAFVSADGTETNGTATVLFGADGTYKEPSAWISEGGDLYASYAEALAAGEEAVKPSFAAPAGGVEEQIEKAPAKIVEKVPAFDEKTGRFTMDPDGNLIAVVATAENVNTNGVETSERIVVSGVTGLAEAARLEAAESVGVTALSLTVDAQPDTEDEKRQALVDVMTNGLDSAEGFEAKFAEITLRANGTPIAEAKAVIEIRIPYVTAGRENFSVTRIHDGQVDKFVKINTPAETPADGTFLVGDGEIVIWTMRFSLYAIGSTGTGMLDPSALGEVKYPKTPMVKRVRQEFLKEKSTAKWTAKPYDACVFAGWVWTNGTPAAAFGLLSENELKNKTLTLKIAEGEKVRTNDVGAVWARIDEDLLGEVELTPEGLLTESKSYVTASVSGLPSGLKFNKKTLAIEWSGKKAPKDATDKKVKVSVKNASGYTFKQTFLVTVTGGEITKIVPADDAVRTGEPVMLWGDAALGKVKGSKVYVAGKKASVRATPAKDSIFLGWYEDPTFRNAATNLPKGYLTASQSVVVPADGGLHLFARFVKLEAWAVGTFDGIYYEALDEANVVECGTVTFTVSSKGRVSGKTLVGGRSYSFSAKALDDAIENDDGLVFITHPTMKVGGNARTLTLCIFGNAPTGLGAAKILYGEEEDAPFAEAVQNGWKRKPSVLPAFDTKALKGPFELGNGLNLKFGTNGKVTVSGKVTGDDGNLVGVSCSACVLPVAWQSTMTPTLVARVYVYVAPKKNLSDGVSQVYNVLLKVGAGGKFEAVSVTDAVPADLREEPATIGVPELQ